MPPRRRPTAEFDATQSEAGPRIVTLDSPIGGYNGYVSPDLLSPKFWAASSNVYAGQFGTIRRARWAPILNNTTTGYSPTGTRILSIFNFFPQAYNSTLFFDNPGTVAWQQAIGMLTLSQATSLPPSFFNGPFMRISISNMLFQANGIARLKILPISAPSTFEQAFWGLDAPDASPQITILAGGSISIAAAPTGAVRTSNIVTITTTAPHSFVSNTYVIISGVTDTSFNSISGAAQLITVTGASTFTFAQVGPNATSGSGTAAEGITKTVGRSYQYAWETTTEAHLSAPSPASQFVKYTSQNGTIDCIEPGTIASGTGSPTINGTNTSFTSAWIGRSIWMEGVGIVGTVLSVQSSVQLTMNSNAGSTLSGKRFQIFDRQATNIKLYATGDGGSAYFLIGRNAFVPTSTTLAGSGLEFLDTAGSEPPNAPFSNELTQIFNVPPPVGSFLEQYQGRILVYGVAAAPQTFFYSNIESTVVGQPPESFGTLNTVTMPIGDGILYGSANLPTGLIIWSNRQDMFKLTGLLTDNTVGSSAQLGSTIQRLPYKIGCASPYATAVTPLGAIWLSSDREVWLFTDHYAPKNIGKPVQDVLNRINGARLAFAKVSYYKRGDRSWLALAIALDSSTFNNKLLLLDLDLLASNGQPSFFTFDLATNAPTWYQYDITSEGICTFYDSNSVNHLLVAGTDLITDVDWQPGFYTVSAEQNVTGSNLLHAFGNEDPHMIKTFQWMRTMTNQVPTITPLTLAGHGSYLTLIDSGGHNWDVFALDTGILETIANSVSAPATFFLNDPSNTASWMLGITTGGLLQTTSVAFNSSYPKSLTIQSITGNSIWDIGVTLGGLLTTTVNTGTNSSWLFSVNSFDDDVNIIGVNPLTTTLIPGRSNPSNSLALEYSPALFKFGGAIPIKGRRFQIGTMFPSVPGLFELRGFEVSYNAVVGR